MRNASILYKTKSQTLVNRFLFKFINHTPTHPTRRNDRASKELRVYERVKRVRCF